MTDSQRVMHSKMRKTLICLNDFSCLVLVWLNQLGRHHFGCDPCFAPAPRPKAGIRHSLPTFGLGPRSAHEAHHFSPQRNRSREVTRVPRPAIRLRVAAKTDRSAALCGDSLCGHVAHNHKGGCVGTSCLSERTGFRPRKLALARIYLSDILFLGWQWMCIVLPQIWSDLCKYARTAHTWLGWFWLDAARTTAVAAVALLNVLMCKQL